MNWGNEIDDQSLQVLSHELLVIDSLTCFTYNV
jgi:hypothetical protein